MGLPRKASITQRAVFAQVRRFGNSRAGRYLVIATLQDDSQSTFKTAFITTRKIGNAVVRNRLRRQLRSIVRSHSSRIQSGVLLVQIARHTAPRATYQQLEKDWLNIAKRLKMLRQTNS